MSDPDTRTLALEREVGELRESMKELRELLLAVRGDVQGVASSAENMDRHIAFVEDIWAAVRRPFVRALQTVGYAEIGDVGKDAPNGTPPVLVDQVLKA